MNPVLVKNGTFAVLLGNGNPITADTLNGDTYLEIKVGDDTPLSPRQRIASVAYAIKANTVPDGAITTDKIVDGAITSTKLGAGIVAFLGGVPSSYLILGYTPLTFPGYTFTGDILSNTGTWITGAGQYLYFPINFLSMTRKDGIAEGKSSISFVPCRLHIIEDVTYSINR